MATPTFIKEAFLLELAYSSEISLFAEEEAEGSTSEPLGSRKRVAPWA